MPDWNLVPYNFFHSIDFFHIFINAKIISPYSNSVHAVCNDVIWDSNFYVQLVSNFSLYRLFPHVYKN